MTQFADLGVSAPILKALAAEGYETPTPIQTQAIPIVLSGRDLVGLAQTGTGKTAAFALPILDLLAKDRRHAGAKSCRALVLAPTRELAAQIGDAFRGYGRFLGLSTAVVFGGASMRNQVHALHRGVDILVATPGRLIDHIQQRTLTLSNVEILVLDEADHMLDMGFIHALRKIAQLVPEKRQSLFFSATMPAPIAELAKQFLNDPARIAVAAVSSTAERVTQEVVHIAQSAKPDLLNALLKDPAITRALVFTRTKHGADKVVRQLEAAGHEAAAIHGNKSQGQRERALEAFKKGRARLLIATEIAARGIDVDDVSHVINYDLPNVPEQYVHRIGRTARAGNGGHAISFCTNDERAYLLDIEKLTKKKLDVLAHALASPTPRADERVPRPPAPRQLARAERNGDRQGDAAGRGKRRTKFTPKPDFERGREERRPQRAEGGRGEGRSGERNQQRRPHDGPPRERSAHHDERTPQRGSHAPRHAPAAHGDERRGERQQHGQQKPQNRGAGQGQRRDRNGSEVWSNQPSGGGGDKRRPRGR